MLSVRTAAHLSSQTTVICAKTIQSFKPLVKLYGPNQFINSFTLESQTLTASCVQNLHCWRHPWQWLIHFRANHDRSFTVACMEPTPSPDPRVVHLICSQAARALVTSIVGNAGTIVTHRASNMIPDWPQSVKVITALIELYIVEGQLLVRTSKDVVILPCSLLAQNKVFCVTLARLSSGTNIVPFLMTLNCRICDVT